MINIPLHSLVLMFGDHAHGLIDQGVPAHQILSPTLMNQWFMGWNHVGMNNKFMWKELTRQVQLRLSMGQRVCVHVSDCQARDLHVLTAHALDSGAQIVIIQDVPLNPMAKRLMHEMPDLITMMPLHLVKLAQLKVQLPDQVLVMGDVHGNYVAMKSACAYAQQHGLFVIWLGDLIDYGAHNLKCVKLAYDWVNHNQAVMIWGNHEKKITRWLDADFGEHYPGRLSEANQITIREILSLNWDKRTQFRAAWKCLESVSTQHVVQDTWLFTHGAAHPHAWSHTGHRMPGQAGEWAYFGEVERVHVHKPHAYPVRLWNWVDQVPTNHHVVVGHDWVAQPVPEVTVKQNAQGGTVICMDTGSSKGGHLSGLHVNLKTNEWEIRAFEP